MRTLSRLAASSAALVLVIAVGGPLAAPASAQPRRPHIAAHPNDLMVNTATQLTGTGFAPGTTLSVKECSIKNWPVMANPCQSANAITVVVYAHGRFSHSFDVTLCGGKHGPFPTSQICYVGVPRPNGIDTMRLVGAARIIVTYP